MRKRSYPGYVKVGKSLYELVLTPHMLDGDKLDANNRGFCQHTGDIKRIVIDKNMPDELIFETLLHEVLHAIEYENGLKISHKLIHNLEAPLAKFLKDNFELRWRRKS